MPNEHIIRKLKSADQQMLLHLSDARAAFEQHGDRGHAVEAAMRKFLRDYTREDVGTGEVIDTLGNISTQTDVVIVGRNHPLTFREDAPGLFFVEGVRAAGEVKSVLDKQMLMGSATKKGVLENSRVFKNLTAMTALPGSNFPYKLGGYEDPYHLHRPWFLVVLESRISIEEIYKAIIDYQAEKALDRFQLLDAVFVVGQGWVINYAGLWPPPDSAIAELEHWSWQWPWKWQESDTVLSDMLAWLSVVMPRNVQDAPLMYWYTQPFWPS